MKIFIYLFSILYLFGASPVYSQTINAAILPLAKTQFLDANGKPLTAGKVYFYEPGTTTLKTTWQDADGNTANANPVTLDAAGRALIYGEGIYRQIVRDRNNNLIWDQLTTSPGSGGSSPTNVGDGQLVGTVKPWAGLVAPAQYAFSYGQELSRASFPQLLAAISLTQNITCTGGSPILTNVASTEQLSTGTAIEANCVAPGSTVLSKTTTTVTISTNATISATVSATFFPFGNGNGSTTYNIPDLRGRTLAGRDNMGGTASGRMQPPYFAASGQGAVGGSPSHTLLTASLPPSTPSGTVAITDPGHIHSQNTTTITQGGGAGQSVFVPTGGSGSSNITTHTTGVTATFTGTAGGGTSTPFSLIQPTVTLNYIIKIAPDVSSSVASGVASIEGMTGILECGPSLLCTGNIIDVVPSLFSATRKKLLSNENYYVRTDGNDGNTCLGNSSSLACATPQYVIKYVMDNIDFGGYTVTLNIVGNGTFGCISIQGSFVGTSPGTAFSIRGISGQPTLECTNTNVVNVGDDTGNGASVYIYNVKFHAITAGSCIRGLNGSTQIIAENVDFNCPTYGLEGHHSAYLKLLGSNTLSGGGIAWKFTVSGAIVVTYNTTLTCNGAYNFSGAFIIAGGGQSYPSSMAFPGCIPGITGSKYAVSNLGLIAAGAGTSYLPGNSAGSEGNGGKYVDISSTPWFVPAGGTGHSSYTLSALCCYADTTATLTEIAPSASATRYITNTGAFNAPIWDQVNLTNGVTGILPSGSGGTNNAFFAVTGPTTSIKTFTFPNASTTVLTTNAAVTVPQGGTGITSYAVGDILYADTTTTLAKLADIATGNVLLSGGIGVAPAWGKVNLQTAVTSTLVVPNGGTGVTTVTTGDILQGTSFNFLNVLSSVATGNALISGGVGVVNSWGKIGLTTHVSGTLPVANGGTGAVTLTGLVLGNGTSPMTAYTGTSCTNQFIRSLNASGVATCNSIAITTDVSGLGTGIATWLATPSSANLISAMTDETGSGSLVFANTPTLVTPVLGVATATSINKVTITAPTTSATLTIADGKTATISNTLAFTGTDGTSFAHPSTSGTVAVINNTQTWTGLPSFSIGLQVTGSIAQPPANTLGLDFASGVNRARFFTVGPDSSTNGGFRITSTRSGGSGAANFIDIDNSGHIFIANVTTSAAAQTGFLCYTTGVEIVAETGAATCLVSSAKFKNEIANLDWWSGLGELMQFRPVSFKYNQDTIKQSPGQTLTGLIAEDVAKIDHRLVSFGEDGQPRGIRYEFLSAHIIQSIQQLFWIVFILGMINVAIMLIIFRRKKQNAGMA